MIDGMGGVMAWMSGMMALWVLLGVAALIVLVLLAVWLVQQVRGSESRGASRGTSTGSRHRR